MARRITGQADVQSDTDSTDSNANEANLANETTNTQEDSNMSTDTVAEATDETTEAPQATVTADPTEATEAPAEAKPEVDMSDFIAAVEAGIEARDPSTGTVPDAQVSAVTEQYRALSVGGKSRAKTHLLGVMTSGVENDDLGLAMAANQLSKALTPAKSSSTSAPKEPKAPADPNEAVATQLAILRTAFGYVKSNLPEGAEPDAVSDKTAELVNVAENQLGAYLDWLNRDEPAEGEDDLPEPEASEVTKKAAKLIRTKVRVATSGAAGPGYSGPRRDVEKHIDEVFANLNSGDFLSINEISKADSSEYGSDHPSSGAVTARLFPKEGVCTLKNVTPSVQADGKRGAVKK